MKRYVELNEDGSGLTLEELRHFLLTADAMAFPDMTRVRVRTKFGGPRGAKLSEISIDNRDRFQGAKLSESHDRVEGAS